MYKFKKVVALVLCATMLATSAVGCSSPASSSSSVKSNENDVSTSDTKGTGATEFWFDKGADQEINDRLAAAWKSDSGVDVKITSYPDASAFQTAMQQSIDQPTAPGLFTWWSGPQLETLVKNGKVADLTDEWKNYIDAGISPDIQKAFTFDGKAYAAPYSILYNVCFYNKTVFDKAGVKEIPKTFDEFLAACEKIKQSGVTPIGLKNDSWASFIWFEAIVASYNPQLYKDVCTGEKKYNDPEMKKIFEVWQSMFKKGYFAKPVLPTDLSKDFAKGKCAIMLEASPTASNMVKDFGMIAGETMDAFVLPSVKADDKGIIFFEASPLCVAKNSKDKDAAIAALRNFYKPATQDVMVNDNGVANTSSAKVENKTLQSIIDMSADSSKYEMILRYYENTNSDVRDVALTALSKFMDGAASIDDTLNTIQAKADEVFKK